MPRRAPEINHCCWHFNKRLLLRMLWNEHSCGHRIFLREDWGSYRDLVLGPGCSGNRQWEAGKIYPQRCTGLPRDREGVWHAPSSLGGCRAEEFLGQPPSEQGPQCGPCPLPRGGNRREGAGMAGRREVGKRESVSPCALTWDDPQRSLPSPPGDRWKAEMIQGNTTMRQCGFRLPPLCWESILVDRHG